MVKLDDYDDCMMENDAEKFDFGFESEVNERYIFIIIYLLFRNGH